MYIITPVVMAGGTGTRLWPVSRKNYPKQFKPFFTDHSLFEDTVLRYKRPPFGPPLIIGTDAFRFIISQQLENIKTPPKAILLEPSARNTAACVLSAAFYLNDHAPDQIMLISPCDHSIADAPKLCQAISRAIPSALAGHIVTFGAQPTSAHTGYGYLQVTRPICGPDVNDPVRGHFTENTPTNLVTYTEKPPKHIAQKMVNSGKYLWNMGIFMCLPQTIISAFSQHAPDFIAPTRTAVRAAHLDLQFTRLSADRWHKIPQRSVDYAIMEKADNIQVMPFDGNWSDVGDWANMQKALPPAHAPPKAGTTQIDCDNTYLQCDSDGMEIVGLGLSNIIAIATKDAVLIADGARTQDVRQVVDKLRADHKPQADISPYEYRPWGWFEVLTRQENFAIKRIVVHSGAALSLQSHAHRSEHWIVISGTAHVKLGQITKTLRANQSVYIPCGVKHRLENKGTDTLIIIEIQTGTYLGDDDITRYGDKYGRASHSPSHAPAAAAIKTPLEMVDPTDR